MAISVTVGISNNEYDYTTGRRNPTPINAAHNEGRDMWGIPYPHVTIANEVTIICHDAEAIDRLICQLTIAKARVDAYTQIVNR